MIDGKDSILAPGDAANVNFFFSGRVTNRTITRTTNRATARVSVRQKDAGIIPACFRRYHLWIILGDTQNDGMA
ncbi:hypothetical protein L0N25_10305, partial [Collinsella aerofaciens]|nr:hypothetical protein [Collinsella aerofaciens]